MSHAPSAHAVVGSSWSNRIAEAVVLILVCAAPWMMGAVHARSQFALIVATGAVVVSTAFSNSTARLLRNMLSVPSLALGGLILLGLAQTAALPTSVLAVLDPATAALRTDVVPAKPEQLGDDQPAPVTLPPATLSHEPGATSETTWGFSWRGCSFTR